MKNINSLPVLDKFVIQGCPGNSTQPCLDSFMNAIQHQISKNNFPATITKDTYKTSNHDEGEGPGILKSVFKGIISSEKPGFTISDTAKRKGSYYLMHFVGSQFNDDVTIYVYAVMLYNQLKPQEKEYGSRKFDELCEMVKDSWSEIG